MPYQGGKIPGNGPNQFAQVGMGGSQGGGQFEQGDGQSGSLQDQQGGTTTTCSVPLDDHVVSARYYDPMTAYLLAQAGLAPQHP